jgi:hypothetical protein
MHFSSGDTDYKETAAMLFWALLASGQITMRRAVGKAAPRSLPIKSLTSPHDQIS